MKYIIILFIIVSIVYSIKNNIDEQNKNNDCMKPPVKPHRDKNGSVIVDNEEKFEADKALYGLRIAYENARKGRYNM